MHIKVIRIEFDEPVALKEGEELKLSWQLDYGSLRLSNFKVNDEQVKNTPYYYSVETTDDP